jgi:hypothetical protein
VVASVLEGQPAGGQWHGGGGPPILSVYHGVEKPSTGWELRVPKFQLSLVLYLSQVCLQHLSKVPDSQSLYCLHLCPVAIMDLPTNFLRLVITLIPKMTNRLRKKLKTKILHEYVQDKT